MAYSGRVRRRVSLDVGSVILVFGNTINLDKVATSSAPITLTLVNDCKRLIVT
jgi:hypothetical protein